MTEQELIDVGNLTRVRVAQEVLRGIVPEVSPAIDAEGYRTLMWWLRHWEQALDVAVRARREEPGPGLVGIRPFPYRQMDDRLAFCGAVREFCKGLPRDTEGCTSYPRCDLTGGVCAFDDPEFDWDRAREIALSQPLVLEEG